MLTPALPFCVVFAERRRGAGGVGGESLSDVAVLGRPETEELQKGIYLCHLTFSPLSILDARQRQHAVKLQCPKYAPREHWVGVMSGV